MKHGTTDILVGDCRETLKGLPDGSVHAAITSPPYWGLRDYKAGEDMIGLEETPEAHIENLLAVFGEVWRVLRDDGTLWVNYGDAYASGNCGGGSVFDDGRTDGRKTYEADRARGREATKQKTLGEGARAGDQMLLPHRVAMALQAEGWILRSTIVWAKGVSFCPTYSGSCMPESLQGTRWERCRVKARDGTALHSDHRLDETANDYGNRTRPDTVAVWSDCPGCEKCSATGGYVLKTGSWRPTSGHEYVFQFAKRMGYYCDAEAIKEKHAEPWRSGTPEDRRMAKGGDGKSFAGWDYQGREYNPSGRNPRTVWTINPAPFSEAHFATFPPALIKPIVKVSTSKRGCCPECGAPWARVVSETTYTQHRPSGSKDAVDFCAPDGNWNTFGNNLRAHSTTLGWRPTCTCNQTETVPATLLDPFGGAGTTGLVANQLGRNAVICELNTDYANMAKARIGRELRPHSYRDDTKETEGEHLFSQ